MKTGERMEIRKLNMLRGLAAFIVVVSHFSNSTKGWAGGYLGAGAGQIGVMVFFILSGFLMSMLYLGKSWTADELKSYVLSRIARVVPLFLIVVLLSYFLQRYGANRYLYDIPNSTSLISHLTLMSGTSVLWTIPPEILFYMLFIFLWGIYQKRRGYFYISIALAIFAIIALKYPRPAGEAYGIPYDVQFFRALPYFFVGLLFGRLYSVLKIPNYLYQNIFVFSIFGFLFLYPKIFYFITEVRYPMWRGLEILFMLSTVFFFVVFLVPNKNPILSNPVGDFLGKISYSLYLLHMPILWQVKKLEIESSAILFVVFIASAIIASYFSYRFIENPCRVALRSFNSNNSRKKDAITVASS